MTPRVFLPALLLLPPAAWAGLNAAFQDLPAPRFVSSQDGDAAAFDALVEKLGDDAYAVREKASAELSDFMVRRAADMELRRRFYERLGREEDPEIRARLRVALDSFAARADLTGLRADRAAMKDAALKSRLTRALRARTPPVFELKVDFKGPAVADGPVVHRFWLKNVTEEAQTVLVACKAPAGAVRATLRIQLERGNTTHSTGDLEVFVFNGEPPPGAGGVEVEPGASIDVADRSRCPCFKCRNIVYSLPSDAGRYKAVVELLLRNDDRNKLFFDQYYAKDGAWRDYADDSKFDWSPVRPQSVPDSLEILPKDGK